MENMYVLSRKDPFFGDVLFYVECKSDTTNISKATQYIAKNGKKENEKWICDRMRRAIPFMKKIGL